MKHLIWSSKSLNCMLVPTAADIGKQATVIVTFLNAGTPEIIIILRNKHSSK